MEDVVEDVVLGGVVEDVVLGGVVEDVSVPDAEFTIFPYTYHVVALEETDEVHRP